nr:hypothetical protein [Escherichia coli]
MTTPKRLTLQPVDGATGGAAGMPGNGVTERSHQLRHCQTECTVTASFT